MIYMYDLITNKKKTLKETDSFSLRGHSTCSSSLLTSDFSFVKHRAPEEERLLLAETFICSDRKGK